MVHSTEADFNLWEVVGGSPADRMAMHIVSAQRKHIGDEVLYPHDGGRVVAESPQNASPDGYDIALLSLARHSPDGVVTKEQQSTLLGAAVPKAAQMLGIDLGTEKLIPPSRFWQLEPEVIAPVYEYFEWVPAIYEIV